MTREAQPLEARLEQLSRLHADGALDDVEFRTAKAAVLGAPAPAEPAALLRPGRGVFVFVAVVLAFTGACVSAAFTSLQRPAGPFVCGSDELVVGQVVERAGSETSFSIDASCRRADGTLEHVSQLKVLAVLWALFTPLACVVVFGLRAVIRAVRRRGASPAAGPDDPGAFPILGASPPVGPPPPG